MSKGKRLKAERKAAREAQAQWDRDRAAREFEWRHGSEIDEAWLLNRRFDLKIEQGIINPVAEGVL